MTPDHTGPSSGDKPPQPHEAEFSQRFLAIVAEFGDADAADAQTMKAVGALARRIMDDAKVMTWSAFKRSQTRELYDATLRTFQKQGNVLVAEGKLRTAYAIQVLAMSMIARTQADAEVQAADRKLDGIIDFLAVKPGNAGKGPDRVN